MNTLRLSRSSQKIILTFVVWRMILFAVQISGKNLLPLQHRYLYGGYWEYIKNPFINAWANFDGNHYLSIAANGYVAGNYSFFPLYPLLVSIASKILNTISVQSVGILISHVSFLLALFGLYKLLRVDYKKDIPILTILLLIIFPSSFYFAAAYTESLFLALSVWSFYFARTSNWLLAGMLGGLASLTRFPGILLFPCLALEYFQQNKNQAFRQHLHRLASLLLVPIGTGLYVLFLYVNTSNPIAFFTELSTYGEHRSQELVLLPQVFYRYFFKIIPNLNIQALSHSFPVILEFALASLVLAIGLLGLKKIRVSYWLFLILGYITASFTGSFSSFPRYLLVMFPFFVFIAKFLAHRKILLTFYIIISTILLIYSQVLFLSGYWLA